VPSSDNRFVRLAARLIKKRGRLVHLISKSSSGDEFNPDISDTKTEITAVNVEFKSSEIDGSLVRVGDKRFIIDSSVRPENDMRLLDSDGIEYSIINKSEIKPGNTTILYKVQVRI